MNIIQISSKMHVKVYSIFLETFKTINIEELMKMITIEDVAKLANTSIATVSRVMNNKGGYSAKTKKRVLKAIESLGYESNAIARSLKRNKTNTIGVLVPNVSSMLSNEILNGIEDYASSHNYSVLTSYSYSEPEKVMRSLKTFQQQRVDGLIFVSDILREEYYNYILKMNIPMVMAANEDDRYPVSFVKVDDFKAVHDAVSYLIEMGHRKIGMISGHPSEPIAGKVRMEGYKKALADANIEVDEKKIIYRDDFDFESGREIFKELVTKHPDITAIFAASDELAVGALNKANELGINIPEDISLIGYDDIPISTMVWPALTTVSQPLEKIGYEATRELIKKIDDDKKTELHYYIPHEIEKRESVMKLDN